MPNTSSIPEFNINVLTQAQFNQITTKENELYLISDGTDIEIINNLSSTNSKAALSANMGKQLNDNKAPKNSPSFTGTPLVPTPAAGEINKDSSQIINVNFLKNILSQKGYLSSTLLGNSFEMDDLTTTGIYMASNPSNGLTIGHQPPVAGTIYSMVVIVLASSDGIITQIAYPLDVSESTVNATIRMFSRINFLSWRDWQEYITDNERSKLDITSDGVLSLI